jgi:metal-responsive CopG/Arc/MetJ family transcriptional regulator
MKRRCARFDQLAAEEGLSRDEFISKALSQILAEFEIGGLFGEAD